MKKLAITVIVFLSMVYLGYSIDKWAFYQIINAVPQTEWLGLIKIMVGFLLFLLTAPIIFAISAIVTDIVINILPKKQIKSTKQTSKSPLVERLEKQMKEAQTKKN